MTNQTPNPNNQNDDIGIDDRKIMAALSYVGVLVLIPLFTRRRDPFVYFHAKQGLIVLLGLVIALIAAAWISAIGTLLFLLLLIADVIALVQALQGKMWKIPVVGKLAGKVRV